MSHARDHKFLDFINLTFGFLVGLFVGVIILASYLASRG